MVLCLVVIQSIVRRMFIERGARPYRSSSRRSIWFYWNEVERRDSRLEKVFEIGSLELNCWGQVSEWGRGPVAAAGQRGSVGGLFCMRWAYLLSPQSVCGAGFEFVAEWNAVGLASGSALTQAQRGRGQRT